MIRWSALVFLLIVQGLFSSESSPGFEQFEVTPSARNPVTDARLMQGADQAQAIDELGAAFQGGAAADPVLRPNLPSRPDFEATIPMDNLRYWTRWALQRLQGSNQQIRMIRYQLTAKGILVQVVADFSLFGEIISLPRAGLAFGPGQIFNPPQERTATAAGNHKLCLMVSVEVVLPGALSGNPTPGNISVKPGAPEFRVFYEEDLQQYAGMTTEKASLERQLAQADRAQHRRINTRLMEIEEKIGYFEETTFPLSATAEVFRIVADALNGQQLLGQRMRLKIVGDQFVVERVDAEVFRFARISLVFDFAGIIDDGSGPRLSLAGRVRR